MRQRVISALWGIPLILAFIWFDTPWFPLLLLFMAGIAALGVMEFYRLGRLSGGRPLAWLGVAWTLGFVANGLFDKVYTAPLLASAAVISLAWLLVAARRRPGSHTVAVDWSWTMMGILYLGWTLGHYVALREAVQGREWALVTLLATMTCDTSAFFVGRAWGRHHMAPRISPRKTWEGAAAGFAGAIGAVFLINFLLGLGGLGLMAGPVHLLVVGVLIGVFSQLGDLWKSSLKRRAGVKDSGSLIPGHGGILDRFDGIIVAGVVVYYYVIWVIL